MKFQPRFESVSAAPVTLEGIEFMAVSAEGRAHCVPADVFALFFSQVETVAPAPAAHVKPFSAHPTQSSPAKKAASANKPKPVPAISRQVAAVTGKPGPTEAILSVVKDMALTTTELTDHAIVAMGNDPKDADARRKMSASITYLKAEGRIVKRECPQTRLDKFFLPATVQGVG